MNMKSSRVVLLMLRCKISRELEQCRCFVSALVTLKVVTKAWDVFFGLHGQTDGTLTVIVKECCAMVLILVVLVMKVL